MCSLVAVVIFKKFSRYTMAEIFFSNADIYSENQKLRVGKKGVITVRFRFEIQIICYKLELDRYYPTGKLITVCNSKRYFGKIPGLIL